MESKVQNSRCGLFPVTIKVPYSLIFTEKQTALPLNILLCVMRAYCTLKKVDRSCFWKDGEKSILYVDRKKVFPTHKKELFSGRNLTIQCKIWKKGEKPVKASYISVRTVFKVNTRTFGWKICNFSCLEPGVVCKLKGDLIDFDLLFNEKVDNTKNLVINITSVNDMPKAFLFKIFVINSEGAKENYVRCKYFEFDLKNGSISIPLLASTFTKNRSRYLPNDELLLDFEYTSLNETILFVSQNCRESSLKIASQVVEKKKNQNHSVLIDPMKSIFSNLIFSDIELRTSKQTYSAHKDVLSTRSDVFRKLFSVDEERTNCGHVDITDLDDDTFYRMLLFIYTDEVEDLQMDHACNLYAAAIKYEIERLKWRCQYFLKYNLSVTNACRILLLADRHDDEELKSDVADFILIHDKEVFRSQEWKDLMESDIQLAANVMCADKKNPYLSFT